MPNKARRNKGRGGTHVPADSLKKFKLNQAREKFMRKMRKKRRK